MKLFYCVWAYLVMVSGAFATDKSSTVLVSDFKAPPGEAWSWAQLALAELAVEALNMRGIVTVDRDLLSAVEKEHALSAMQPQQEGLKAGQWLGATFLLKGELESLQGSRVRLSATLTRVETVEQVSIFSVEGDYTTELQPLVGRLVAGLAKGASLDVQALKPEQVNPVKPEALLFFQKGVDACAAGKPSLAVGFFRIASAMAPKFIAAREWEAQAYSLGGLPQHAAALRIRIEQQSSLIEKKETPEASSLQTRQSVVSVLTPIVPRGVQLPESNETLHHVVEQSVLDCGKMRLYNPSQLSEAVTEADRQLSLQFSRASTSRYARWLSADYLLFTRVEPLTNGTLSLILDVRHAFSSVRVATLQRAASAEQVKTTLGSMVHEWQVSVARSAVPEAMIPLVPLVEADLQRVSEHRDLVQMLDIRMREPKKFTIEQHLALAASFSSQATPEVFKLETEEAMRKAESFEQHLSLATYFFVQKAEDLLQREIENATKKVQKLSQRQQLAESLVEFKKRDQAMIEWQAAIELIEASPPRADSLYDSYLWTSDFVWDPAMVRVFTANDLARVRCIRARLLAEFPVSVEVFELRYFESYRAYEEEQWAICLTNATVALDALEILEKKHREAKAPPPFTRRNLGTLPQGTLRLGLYFLQFKCFQKVGDRSGARVALEKAIEVKAEDDDSGLFDGCFPFNCNGSFERRRVGVAFGPPAQGRKPQDHKRWGTQSQAAIRPLTASMLKNELAIMDAEDAEKAQPVKSQSLNEEIMKLLLEVDSADPQANARFLGYVCDVWKDVPASTNAHCPLVDQAVTFLKRAGHVKHEGERTRLVDQLARAYLRVTSSDAEALMACRDAGWVVPRLTQIMAFYMAAGCEEQGLKWILPFLDGQVDATLGADILLTACGGLPVEQGFRLWKTYRENHRGFENTALAAFNKKYCDRLMEQARQTFAEDPKSWHTAVTAWQDYSTNMTVSVQQAEFFVPRVTVLSLSTDPLCEATRLLQHMKVSLLVLTNNHTAWIHWYRAGVFYLNKGNNEQALQAFRAVGLLSSSCATAEAWHSLFLEGKALAATGQPAEAAKRFRRISQELGTRAFVINETYLPLGLMSARESLKLHVPESEWAARDVEERDLSRLRGLLDAASNSKVQVEEGQIYVTSNEGTKFRPTNENAKSELLSFSIESGKILNLSLDWTASICGTNPATAEDLCLRAISLLQNGNPKEARRLMKKAKKINPEGCFTFIRTPYESCKMGMGERYTWSAPVVDFWLARACEGCGDVKAACEAIENGLSHIYRQDAWLVLLGQEYERLTGQRLEGEPQDGQQYRLAVLRIYAEKGKDWHWAQWRIVVEGLKGLLPVKDCLKIVDIRLQEKPEDVEFNMFKALLLLKDGRAKEALPFARKVSEKEPGNQPGRYALGAALLEVGDTEDAIRELRLAYNGSSDNWTKWFWQYKQHYRQLSTVSLLDALAKQSGSHDVNSPVETSGIKQ
jgi:tetratricopeptide (TPR) repeat protein